MSVVVIIASYLMAAIGTAGSIAFGLEYVTAVRPRATCLMGAVLLFAMSAALATVVPWMIGGGA